MRFFLDACLNPKCKSFVWLVETAAKLAKEEELEQEGHDDVVVGDGDGHGSDAVEASDLVVGIEADEAQPRRKRVRIKPPLTAEPALPQELETKLKELCGENPICLVVQKTLFKTDTSTAHARISMPFKQVKTFDFLTEDEREMLQQEAEKLHTHDRRSITVKLIYKPRTNGGEGLDLDDAVKETEMKLGQWNMHKKKDKNGKEKKPSCMYVLNGKQHKEVVKENMLDEDVEIQIWASRTTIGEKVCLALFVPEKDQEDIVMAENNV